MFRPIVSLGFALMLLSSQAWPEEALGMKDGRLERLQVQLQQHRDIAAAGGWPVIPEGPTIRPGADDPRVAVLAKRLAASGDFADLDIAVPLSAYDEVMQDAVRRFQARHGLETDALVGTRTLRALNVPVEHRIDQILLNLERVIHKLGDQDDDYILINIPAFKAYVVRGATTIATAKIIVGETEAQTPIFDATLKYIVFNPTWTVPRSIASEEMLPKIQRDAGFLDKGHYQVFDAKNTEIAPSAVDWSTLSKDNFPYTLVQRPGPWNELGQIKFMFPNDYSVCMHDTPGKALFARARRAFSHGCIRVNEPLDFAEVLLRSEGWTREQIDGQVATAETSTVTLSQPLPVLLVYWTADVDELGVMHFYEDIYERDAAAFGSSLRDR